MSKRKIKPWCELPFVGKNFVWNSLYVHTAFAAGLGWLVFIVGNTYLVVNDFPFWTLLILNYASARNAMWTADFLLKIHTYKNNKK